ncbi:hypothetical protein [Halorhodospira halophila]|nr:hypothetical protein [Halorhodospira halophila]
MVVTQGYPGGDTLLEEPEDRRTAWRSSSSASERSRGRAAWIPSLSAL